MLCSTCQDTLCGALQSLARCKADGYTAIFGHDHVAYTLGPVAVLTTGANLLRWSNSADSGGGQAASACPLAQYLVKEIKVRTDVDPDHERLAQHLGNLTVFLRTPEAHVPNTIRGELGFLEVAIGISSSYGNDESDSGSISGLRSDTGAVSIVDDLNPIALNGNAKAVCKWVTEIYTDDDDPVSSAILGRPIYRTFNSTETLDLARSWISRCTQGIHDHCPAIESAVLPTRLLCLSPTQGVDSDTVRVVLTSAGQRGHYVALSYCWGRQQALVLTTATLDSMMRGVPICDLPKTIADAIWVTRQLGFEYIWIDAFCIIQDSDQDKAREISKMHEVYRSATVTVSADRASHCHNGFLGSVDPTAEEDERHVVSDKIAYRTNGGMVGKVQLRSMDHYFVPSQPIYQRGWTFQEQFLSSRILFFGDQLSWRCRSGKDRNFGQGSSISEFAKIPMLREGVPFQFQHLESLTEEIQYLPHQAQSLPADSASKALWNSFLVYAGEKKAVQTNLFAEGIQFTDGRVVSAYNAFLEAVHHAHRAVRTGRWRVAFRRMTRYANVSGGGNDSKLLQQAVESKDWKSALRHCLPSVFCRYYRESSSPDQLMEGWFSTVAQFAERGFTSENDRLHALSGVAAEFKDRFEGRYIAGVWERHLFTGIAWHQATKVEAYDNNKLQRLEMGRGHLGQTVTAPSWSWASVAGGVQFHGKETDETLDATYLGCDITLASDENPLGQVTKGVLTLYAPVRSVYLSWFSRRPGNKHEHLMDTVRVPTWKIMEAISLPFYSKYAYPDNDRTLLFALLASEEPEEPLAYPEDPFWLMRLFRKEDPAGTVKSRGLVLTQNNDGTFRRVGYYDVSSPRYPDWLVKVGSWLEIGAYEHRIIKIV